MKKTRILRICICLGLLFLVNKRFASFWKVYTSKVANKVVNQTAKQAHESADSEKSLVKNGMREGSYNGKGEKAFGPFTVPVFLTVSSVMREQVGEEWKAEDPRVLTTSAMCINGRDGFLDFFWRQDELTHAIVPAEIYEEIWDGLFAEKSYKVTAYCRENEELIPLEITALQDGTEKVLWSEKTAKPEQKVETSDDVRIEMYAKPEQFQTYFGKQAWNYATVNTGGIYQPTMLTMHTFGRLDRYWTTETSAGSVVSNDYFVLASPLRGRIWFFVFTAILAAVLVWIMERVLGRLEKKLYVRYYKPQHETMVIGALAHDLKTSFMVIEGSAENLMAGVSKEKEQTFLAQMDTEVSRIHQVVTKMEQFRDTSELKDIPLETMELNGLIRRVAERYEALAKSRQIQIRVNEKAVFSFQGEMDLADMVVDNFIHNAVKYAKNDTVFEIVIEEKCVLFRNEWEPAEAYIRNPEQFFTAYDVGNRERGSKQGSGVGLSIAANILRYFGLQYKAITGKEAVCFEIRK